MVAWLALLDRHSGEGARAVDRLIRDVATGVRIAGVYANAKRRGVSDWGPVHQQGADMMLRLIQVNRGVYIKVQCSAQSHWQRAPHTG